MTLWTLAHLHLTTAKTTGEFIGSRATRDPGSSNFQDSFSISEIKNLFFGELLKYI